MPRKINISKYRGNTDYSVHVTDSYGTEHHLGYWRHVRGYVYLKEIEEKAEEIWANEVKPIEDLMSKAIANCIELDKKNGLHFTDSKGNHRDGLD